RAGAGGGGGPAGVRERRTRAKRTEDAMYCNTTGFSCSRRAFLQQTALASAGLLLGRDSFLSPRAHAAPALLTPADARPQLPYGAMTGDITNDRIIVSSKADP